MSNLRKFAAAVDTPILEALVIAGYLTEDEARHPDASAEPTIRAASNQELLDELADRLNTLSPTVTQRGGHRPDLPQTEAQWPRSAAPSARNRTQPGLPPRKRRSSQ